MTKSTIPVATTENRCLIAAMDPDEARKATKESGKCFDVPVASSPVVEGVRTQAEKKYAHSQDPSSSSAKSTNRPAFTNGCKSLTWDDVDIGEFMGSGSYASVYRVKINDASLAELINRAAYKSNENRKIPRF